jgi:hypothetical protein
VHGTFAALDHLFRKRKRQTRSVMNKNRSERTVGSPVVVVAAVAIFGLLAMLIVDHGPWSRPQVQTAEVANYHTTGAAARAVGATVTPTAPKAELEPEAPGPKPAQPANPATPSPASPSHATQ